MNHFEWNWTQDGTRFYAQGWSPVATKAVICLVHGFGEHSGRYAHVAERLSREGYAVLAFDQYGHGHTDGPRGYSPSLDGSLDSIKLILDETQKRFPGVPKFLYGHSMGGNMVLNYLLRRKPKIAGAIVTSPWLRLAFDPPAIQLFLAKIMRVIYPKFAEQAKLDTSMLTHDQVEVKKYEQDPLVHGTARAGTFFDTHTAGQWVLENARELEVPILLLHGTQDKIIAPSGSEEFAAKGPKDLIIFKPYEGLYHELHNESASDRERVMLDEIAWLNGRLETLDKK